MHPKTQQLEGYLQQSPENIAGLVVLKNGKVIYQAGCNGCAATHPVHVFSITKSVVSALVGIALGQGHIQSVDQKVLGFFPAYTPKRGEKTAQSITLRHLLTMTAPYKYRSAPYTRYFTSESWVTAALDLLGGKTPPGRFRYTPLIGPDILCGILAAATGQPVRAFAVQNLFGPLGIPMGGDITFQSKEEQMAFLKTSGHSGWVADPRGINTAGWGLALSAADMAKIGQLYLAGGAWGGRQILPAEWVGESLRPHSHWPEKNLSYGYLWWPLERGFAAMGDCGNTLYVNPKAGLVVAIASLYKPSAKDRLALIAQHIEPLFC